MMLLNKLALNATIGITMYAWLTKMHDSNKIFSVLVAAACSFSRCISRLHILLAYHHCRNGKYICRSTQFQLKAYIRVKENTYRIYHPQHSSLNDDNNDKCISTLTMKTTLQSHTFICIQYKADFSRMLCRSLMVRAFFSTHIDLLYISTINAHQSRSGID